MKPSGAQSSNARTAFGFVRDQHGSVYVEYVIVVAFVGLVVVLGLLAIGPRTVENYSNQRKALYSHHP